MKIELRIIIFIAKYLRIRKIATCLHTTMNQVIPTRGKKGFPSPFSVHIVCEQPPSYYQLNSKKKCEKSLHKKELHSYFHAGPGSEPTD